MYIITDEDRGIYYGSGIQKEFALTLDHFVRTPGRDEARVVGIDLYTATNYLGERINWHSNTLDDGKNRFGLTFSNQFGARIWDDAAGVAFPANLKLVAAMSGYVNTRMIGNAVQASPHGSLSVFQERKSKSSTLYALEVFEGTKPLRFCSTPVDPRTLLLA